MPAIGLGSRVHISNHGENLWRVSSNLGYDFKRLCNSDAVFIMVVMIDALNTQCRSNYNVIVVQQPRTYSPWICNFNAV